MDGFDLDPAELQPVVSAGGLDLDLNELVPVASAGGLDLDMNELQPVASAGGLDLDMNELQPVVVEPRRPSPEAGGREAREFSEEELDVLRRNPGAARGLMNVVSGGEAPPLRSVEEQRRRNPGSYRAEMDVVAGSPSAGLVFNGDSDPLQGLSEEEAADVSRRAARLKDLGKWGPLRQGLKQAGIGLVKGLDKAIGLYEEHGMYGREEEAGEVFAPAVEKVSKRESMASSIAYGDKRLPKAVEGATRSVATALSLAYLNVPLIPGFAALRASDAEDEAEEAGLEGIEKFGYVGRAALIEGGITYAFQRVGLGGFEKYFGKGGGAVSPKNVREFAKDLLVQNVAELVEENSVEIADRLNQKLSDVQEGPIDWANLLIDTSLTTLVAGAASGAKGAYSQNKVNRYDRAQTKQLIEKFGLEAADAERVMEATWNANAKTEKEFLEVLGSEISKVSKATAAKMEEVLAGGGGQDTGDSVVSWEMVDGKLKKVTTLRVRDDVGAGEQVAGEQVAGGGSQVDAAQGRRVSLPVVVPESGEWVADTPKGERQVRGSWRVVDAAEVVSSDMEGFDQALQPRNRRSVTSAAQVDEIARRLNPNRLLDSPTTDDGAPVVSADNQVISGNGRMMALRAAYKMGTAEGYRAMVAAQAEALGLDVSGMARPVLVRALDGETVDLVELAELSNKPKILERSAAEIAAADAALLSPELLSVLDMEQPLTEKGNPEFFAGFVGAARDASLLKADGSIDAGAARKRVGNAIVAALAAGHPQAREVIGTLTERAEELGLSKQLEAISRAAPALIRTGALKPEYDLRGAFGKAMNELVQFAKANGERKANGEKPISMREWTGQLDIFSPRDSVADELSRVLMGADPGQVRQILDRYAELAGKIDTSTADMFGEANASALELLHRAAAEVEVPVPSKAEAAKAKRKAAKNVKANVAPDLTNQMSKRINVPVNQDGAPGDISPADSRQSPEQVNQVLTSFYDKKMSNPSALPQWAKQAWEYGKSTAEKSYDEIANNGLVPSWVFNDHETSTFFEAGRRDESPEYVVGFRFGDIPESGRSKNHASNEAELGVSTAYAHGRTDQELNALTMIGVKKRKVVHVEGWAFPKSEWGGDGEIVLHGAKVLKDAPQGNPFDQSPSKAAGVNSSFRGSEVSGSARSGGRNAKATVSDITGAGWPGGEIQPAFRVELPEVPEAARAAEVRPLAEYIGRPLQVPVETVLNALEGSRVEGAEVLSTVPGAENVRVDLDPFLLQGAVDMSPGWEAAWEQGAARFVSEVSNDTLLRAVRSISMPAAEFEKVKDSLQSLVRNWDGHVSESGNVVLSRPGHTRQILELPELVELAQELGNGALPKIIGRFRNAEWLGVFRHGTPGKESIELRSDIFQLVTPAEVERLRTQADVYAAKLQEADSGIDDVARAAIAKDKHRALLEEAKAEARRNNPRLASKVLAHEIAHWVDHLPDHMINSRGNILGRLGVLSKYLKSELSLIPDQSPGLTKLDRNKLRSEARKRVRHQGGNPKDADFNARVNKMFGELRDLQRKRSGLVSKEEIQGELRNFIAWWRGTETMEEYFEAPAEMYAEAISGYILNPAELGRRAPLTFGLIENYIHKKPSIKRMWDRTQAEILSGQVQKNRVNRTREMFEEGNRVDTAVGRAKEITSRETQDAILRTVDRKYGPIYKRAKQWTDAKGGELVEAIARYRYRSNQHERYVQDVNTMVLRNLVDNNLEWADLEEYMLHYRVLNEREDMANPLGWNVATSQDRLTEWRREIGEERFGKLEESRRAMRRLYEDHVLKPLRNSGALDPELMAYLESNEAYATFVTHRGEEDALDNALSGRYGNQVTSHVYKQVGTLQKIHGPATKTMEKGIQIIDMAMRNVAIEGMVDMLNEINTGEIVPAEMRFDGRKMSPVVVNNSKMKTVMFLKGGEVKAYNVPKVLADAWESAPNTEMVAMRKVNEIFSQKMKALFTGWNYGIWPVLWIRDVQDFKRRMPRRGNLPLQGPTYWRLFFGALKDAKSMATSSPTATAQEAMNRGLTVSSANFRGIWGEEQALNRLMKKYHQTPAARAEDRKAGQKLNKLWNKYIETGQVLERVSKIAGMRYMDKYFPDMPEYQRNQKVRMFAGSQDFLDTPTLLPVIDLFQMFYNPWKQGWRSEIESFKQHGPAMYAYTNFKYSVMPTMLKWAIWSGAATSVLSLLTGGDEEEAKEIEKQMKSVSEYDLMASHIVPLGWANRDERAATYLRLPMSESQRLIAATTWKILRALTEDGESGQPAGQSLRQAVSYAGDQMPTGNPLYNAGKAIFDFYVSGQNPVDGRTGYNIIPQTEFEAGGWEAGQHLLKYSLNNLGGSVIHRFDLYEDDRQLTDFEKFLKKPVVSNTVGRFIRVSNRGLYDAVRPIDAEVDKQRARQRLDIRDAVESGEFYMPTDEYSARTYERELKSEFTDSMTSLEQRILDGVTGDEAKMKALNKIRAIMD